MKKMKYILLLTAIMFLVTGCGKKEVEEVEKADDITVETQEEPIMLFGHFDSQTLEGEEVTEEIFANAVACSGSLRPFENLPSLNL